MVHVAYCSDQMAHKPVETSSEKQTTGAKSLLSNVYMYCGVSPRLRTSQYKSRPLTPNSSSLIIESFLEVSTIMEFQAFKVFHHHKTLSIEQIELQIVPLYALQFL